MELKKEEIEFVLEALLLTANEWATYYRKTESPIAQREWLKYHDLYESLKEREREND